MNPLILCIVTLFLSTNIALANTCFIVKEKGTILVNEGNCNKRYPPMSTFKIALSLIGFDSGILINETNPVWSFQKGYVDWRDTWKQDHTPKSWITESCVWYSQVLTRQLGMRKLKTYVTNFDYGNKNLSGDKGQNNGLTNAWLSSSLKISGLEQITFLEKMLVGSLPVSPYASIMTKNILFIEELNNGWKLYGKTGMGELPATARTKNLDLYHGWFVGWVEKGDRKIIFSNHIEDEKYEKLGASLRAKIEAKTKLTNFLEE